jgi:hypothetical protein
VLLAGCLLATGLIAPPLQAQNFTFSTIAGGAQGSNDGVDANAQFNNPTGVAVDSTGNIYVADQGNNLIRKISPLGTDWTVATIAGGIPGSLDGTNTAAQFFGPTGIALDAATNLYVADQYNDIIRKITLSGTNWVVTTIAGAAGVPGMTDGTNGVARFSNPTGVAVDGAGNIFVADEVNNAIRKITLSGTNWIVTTIAGGTLGSSDGTNTAAQFFRPCGVAVDANDHIFVTDQFNNTIRLIIPMAGNWVVTTIAGQLNSGLSNGLGTNALFYVPLGAAVDINDNVYVAETDNAIRELVPSTTNWMVSTIGGGLLGTNNGTGTNAAFDVPFGVAVDTYGDIFVADSKNNAIRFGIAASSPPPTGGLEVMILPSSAVSEGAEWQVDGGVFQTNGAILSGLVPGNHAISFSTVAGFTTPAVQTVLVTAHQTTLATGNFPVAIANAGSLQVMISPAAAVAAGAQWRVDTESYQPNGAIVAGLSIGAHILSFNTNSGWTTPLAQMVTITNSQTTLGLGTYVLQAGSLQVTLLPPAIVTAGAKWQVDGGTFQASGATWSGLLPGSHTINFNTVLGWKTPASQVVTITNTLTTPATGFYTQPPQLAGMTVVGGKFQFVLSGQVGTNYAIQASSDLAVWTTIFTVTMPAGGFMTFTDSNMTSYIQRFYRAVAIAVSPPQLSGMSVSQGTAQFVLNGSVGISCVIQASSNLVSWTAIFTNTIPESGSMLITDAGATNQRQRFYRAVNQ